MNKISLKRSIPLDFDDSDDFFEQTALKLSRYQEFDGSPDLYDDVDESVTVTQDAIPIILQVEAAEPTRQLLGKRQASWDLDDDSLFFDNKAKQIKLELLAQVQAAVDELFVTDILELVSEEEEGEENVESDNGLSEQSDDDNDDEPAKSDNSIYEGIMARLFQIDETTITSPDSEELDVAWDSLSDEQFDEVFELHSQIRENIKVGNKENMQSYIFESNENRQ